PAEPGAAPRATADWKLALGWIAVLAMVAATLWLLPPLPAPVDDAPELKAALGAAAALLHAVGATPRELKRYLNLVRWTATKDGERSASSDALARLVTATVVREMARRGAWPEGLVGARSAAGTDEAAIHAVVAAAIRTANSFAAAA
ncbi:MAG TPA: hypothetical protein VEI02_07080, partial [Planctomycetota bacterium]|nr:hypothetical protein [Planctomycetota bacterium]